VSDAQGGSHQLELTRISGEQARGNGGGIEDEPEHAGQRLRQPWHARLQVG